MKKAAALGGNVANRSGEAQSDGYRKDQKLDRLAERFNVAQFVSFGPVKSRPVIQYSRLSDLAPNSVFENISEALGALFERSSEGTVNVRSFSETEAQSREFLYGLRTVAEAEQAVTRFAREGAFSIVNETIDVSDGGVSGVAMGDLVEFLPDSTPRGVEGAGFASLPRTWATQLFKMVYGIDPLLESAEEARIEFSLHPKKRGWRRSHVIFWEYGDADALERSVDISWPNSFSRMMGDKAYGLLIAHIAGFPVPLTTVIGRRIAPFTFGSDTGSSERWTRTSPAVQIPGKFTTVDKWVDPFALVQAEDPSGKMLASILSQQSVRAQFSGAAIESADGELIVEGAHGSGEAFMLGASPPEPLPDTVVTEVKNLHALLQGVLGSVRFEWVFDGLTMWLVQLHVGASPSSGRILVPGEAENWVTFDTSNGLEALRTLLEELPAGTGVYLNGEVGRTSHVADVARKSNVPTRLLY